MARHQSLSTLQDFSHEIVMLDDGRLPIVGKLLPVKEIAENQTEITIETFDGTPIIRRIFCSAKQLAASLAEQNKSNLSGLLTIDVTDWPYLKGVPRYVPQRDADTRYIEEGTKFPSRPHIFTSAARPSL